MTRWLKLGVLLAMVGFSACVVASPTQTSSAEGQVMSVVAVDISALAGDLGYAPRSNY